MIDLFKKRKEEKRKEREAEISNMNYDELVSLKYRNDLEIERLRKKAIETKSFMYANYCESQARDLEWENTIIIHCLNA